MNRRNGARRKKWLAWFLAAVLSATLAFPAAVLADETVQTEGSMTAVTAATDQFAESEEDPSEDLSEEDAQEEAGSPQEAGPVSGEEENDGAAEEADVTEGSEEFPDGGQEAPSEEDAAGEEPEAPEEETPEEDISLQEPEAESAPEETADEEEEAVQDQEDASDGERQDAEASGTSPEELTEEAPPAAEEALVTEPEAEAVPAEAYRDGSYEGSGTGYGGTVTMRVTIEGGRITAIETVSQSETAGYWESAIEVTDRILAAQQTDVDSITGATRSSEAIKQAVRNALDKAIVPENAEAFESGAGTESNPFVILTASQLSAFAATVDEGETYEGQYIVLGGDIDLSEIENWNPIGSEGNPGSNKDRLFNGSFDGQGYSVSGLTISGDHADWQNAGLFSALNTSAQIRDLTISGAISLAASSTTRAGILTGDSVANNSGTAAVIDSVNTEGQVSVYSENDSMLFAGGIAGRLMAGAVVSNSWTDVSVSAQAAGAGFPSAYAGGIVGMAGNRVALVNDAAFGDVYGCTPRGETLVANSGGLAGMFPGYLYSSYANGDVTYGRAASSPHTWAGALLGQATKNASAAQVYQASDAALTLQAWSGDSHEDSALSAASGSSTSNGAFMEITPTQTLTRAEMADASFAEALTQGLQETYLLLKNAGLDEVITLREWQADDGRVLPNGANWYTEIPDAGIFASGTGTGEDPWIIMTADQMFAFASSLGEKMNYEGYTVALGADIDLSEKAWTPVGLSEYGFGGTFDGRNHTIRNMHKGTEGEAEALAAQEPYFALFGVLENTAVVKNVNLADVMVNITYPSSTYVAGIAGYMASVSSDNYAGAVIDNCHVDGKMTTEQEAGNLFLGGIAAYQYKGAVINCSTDLDLSGTVTGEALAEVGGIAALVNRGLVANCYSLGDLYGSGNREDGNEGMAVVSSLVAVDAGALAGSYGAGGHTAKEFSTYVGTVSGWVTGIGKAYSCWYNGESVMTVNGEKVNPVESIGTRVPGGKSEEGMVYTGGVVDELQSYKAAAYASIADSLNAKFAAYPIDITQYGVAADSLRKWTYTGGLVTFADETAAITYVQPEAEIYVEPEKPLRDGDWYGRDTDKTAVVKITVRDGAITETEVLSGEKSGDAYEAALAVAKEKATYGDFSHYEAADPSRFAGGDGTKESPYLISTADQLQYLSASINEDTDWEGVWFRQTADIDLAGIDWIPIGWALEAEIDSSPETFCAYPFKGNYDGGGCKVKNLTIGSKDAPSELLTIAMFGLTSGEYNTNEVPTDDVRRVVLKDIHLEDAAVCGSVRYQIYAAALVGSAQNGIEMDRCSAAGTVTAQTADSHCRAGGLAASGLRGKMTNCMADVEVNASTDTGRVYAGGLTATSNRLTMVNCFALGNVTGGSTSNNTTYVGGLDGMEGGVHINCYSSGDVTSTKTTAGIGASNGLVGGISVNKACYYNSDASLTAAGNPAEMKSSGANYANATDETSPKSGEEIVSKDFAALLNENIANISTILASVNEELEGGSHLVYYTGDGTDLEPWTVADGIVTFGKTYVEVTGLTLNKTTANVAATKTLQLVATPDPVDATDKAVTWTSSDSSVAKVDANGKVKALKYGKAVITAKASNGLTAACTVNVLFKDVANAGKSYFQPVYWAVNKGITNVTVNFRPEDSVTRGEFVAFLWRLAGEPNSSAKVSFKDVNSKTKFYKAIRWAVGAGIIKGYGDRTFKPENDVTRGETATMIWRYAGKKTPKTKKSPFSDIKITSADSCKAILWGSENGIIKGSGGKFLKNDGCTRGQVVTFLYRYANK